MKNTKLFLGISIILFIFLGIFLFLEFRNTFSYQIVNFEQFKLLLLVVFAMTIFSIVNSVILEKNFLNLYTIYVIFYFIFNFGLVFLRYYVGYECEEITMYLDYLFTLADLYKATLLSSYCFFAINIGYLFVRLFLRKNTDSTIMKKYNKKITDLKEYEKLFKVLLVFTLPFVIFEYLKKITLVLNYGYSGNYNDLNYGLASIGEKILPFYTICTFILMLMNKNDKKKAKFYLIIGVVYNFGLILLGARGQAILKIVMYIYIWYKYISKINIKEILKFSLVAFILVLSITIIRQYRDISLNEWVNNIFGIASQALKNNILYEVIYEMGMAIYPTASAIRLVPNVIPYFNGSTYLYSFINSFIFNFGTSDKNITNNYNIGYIIAEQENIQYGSSFIEESYANFGMFSIIFCALITIIFVKFIDYINRNENNCIIVGLCLYFYSEILWTIRNVTYNLPRIYLLYFFSILIVVKIMSKIKKEKYC